MSNTFIQVFTDNANEKKIGYCRLTQVGNWIYSSTTGGKNFKTGIMPLGAAEQTLQVLANLQGALDGIGASLKDTVRVDVIIRDASDTDEVLSALNKGLGDIKPAHVLNCGAFAHPDMKVELAVVLYRRDRAQAKNEIVDVKLS